MQFDAVWNKALLLFYATRCVVLLEAYGEVSYLLLCLSHCNHVLSFGK